MKRRSNTRAMAVTVAAITAAPLWHRIRSPDASPS